MPANYGPFLHPGFTFGVGGEGDGVGFVEHTNCLDRSRQSKTELLSLLPKLTSSPPKKIKNREEW